MFDSFTGDNFNTAIVGRSGSGKSFLTQKIVDYHLKSGKSAVILDRGDSFKRLAQYHEGTIFKGKINPFQFKNAAYLTEFLTSFIPNGELTYKDKCRLRKIITDNLDSENLSNLLSNIDRELDDFSLYFEQYKDFFTDKAIAIKNITYFDTRDYPDGFLRPLFVYLTEYIKQLKGKKIFVFEECWHTLKNNIDYVGEFFRTSRSQGISCIAVTQLLNDLTNSELGLIVAENTYFKIFFSSSREENEYLDRNDVSRINQLSSQKGSYSEFYIKSPIHRKTIRYYPTCLEH